jgi:hypothetical protein
MLNRAALSAEVLEERSASVIMETRPEDLGTLTVTSNRSRLRRNTTANVVSSSLILVTLMMEAIRSSDT